MSRRTRVNEGWSRRTNEEVGATLAAFERLSLNNSGNEVFIDQQMVSDCVEKVLMKCAQVAKEEWWQLELTDNEQRRLAELVAQRRATLVASDIHFDDAILMIEEDIYHALLLAREDFNGTPPDDKDLIELVDAYVNEVIIQRQRTETDRIMASVAINETQAKQFEEAFTEKQLPGDLTVHDLPDQIDSLQRQRNPKDTALLQASEDLAVPTMPAELFSHSLLSAEEEQELFYLMDQGSEAAWDKMIISNTRLIRNIASRYARRAYAIGAHLTKEDLFQEGVLGMVKAIEKFDPSQGFKFSTYATWWIRQAMLRAIEEKGSMVRLPSYLRSKETAVHAAIDHLMADNIQPTPVKIAEIAGVTLSEAQALLSYELHVKPTSLNKTINEEGTELADVVAPASLEAEPDKIAILNLIREELGTIFAILPERIAYILQQRFWENRTLDDIGEEMSISRERVRQLSNQGLSVIRASYSSEYLHDLFDDMDFGSHETESTFPKAHPKKLYASKASSVPGPKAASRPKKGNEQTSATRPKAEKVIQELRKISDAYDGKIDFAILCKEKYDTNRIFDAGFERMVDAFSAIKTSEND